MDPRDQMDSEQLDTLSRAFSEQLLACLDECARGRHGLFSESISEEDGHPWPEAARLRELAIALQAIFAQQGERKLPRAFLERIERGEVGAPTQDERKPW